MLAKWLTDFLEFPLLAPISVSLPNACAALSHNRYEMRLSALTPYRDVAVWRCDVFVCSISRCAKACEREVTPPTPARWRCYSGGVMPGGPVVWRAGWYPHR